MNSTNKAVKDLAVQDHHDNCGICHHLMVTPTAMGCGHVACHSCLLKWVMTTEKHTLPLHGEPVPPIFTIQGLVFNCPFCQIRGDAEPDVALGDILEAVYPAMLELRDKTLDSGLVGQEILLCIAARDVGTWGLGFVNSRAFEQDLFAPVDNMIRLASWELYAIASRPDIIQTVDLVMRKKCLAHNAFCLDRANQPPYTFRHVGALFKVTISITLRAGWIWAEEEAVKTRATRTEIERSQLDVDFVLPLRKEGGQEFYVKKFQHQEWLDGYNDDDNIGRDLSV